MVTYGIRLRCVCYEALDLNHLEMTPQLFQAIYQYLLCWFFSLQYDRIYKQKFQAALSCCQCLSFHDIRNLDNVDSYNVGCYVCGLEALQATTTLITLGQPWHRGKG